MEYKKILLLNIAGIGDFMEFVPVIIPLRERYKDATISLIVSSKVFDYAKRCKYIDEVYQIPTKGGEVIFSLEMIKCIKKLRKYKYDIGINFSEISDLLGAIKMFLFMKLLNPKFSAGRDTHKLGFFYDIKVPENSHDQLNESEYYLRVAEAIGVDRKKCKMDFWYTEDEKNKTENLFTKLGIKDKDFLIGINPGGERTTRWWFPERFAEVINQLSRKYNAKFVILGSKEEKFLAEEIKKFSETKNVYSISGETTLGEVILVIKRCNLVISTNSAAMHISALVGTPVVGLIGPGDIYRNCPAGEKSKLRLIYKPVRCSPCYYYKCPKKEKICMTNITAIEVVKSAEELLKGTDGS